MRVFAWKDGRMYYNELVRGFYGNVYKATFYPSHEDAHNGKEKMPPWILKERLALISVQLVEEREE